jgi:site-specific DNA-cytosine methylase
MYVLDLFSGLGGWSKAFVERGHRVVTIDIEPKFKPTICKDIMTLTAEDIPDFDEIDLILASPPCNCFSVASIYRHWNKDGTPKDQRTLDAIKLVRHTLDIIESLNPTFWFMENPRGMLRKVIGLPTSTITQCQYGRGIMKSTDLWGEFPKSFVPKKCNNRDSCHASAKRGSHSGTQGIDLKAYKKNRFAYDVPGGGGNSALRAEIPYGLSLAVCKAVEKDLGVKQ